MSKIVSYKAVTALTPDELSRAITLLIQDGWEPFEGIATSSVVYKQFDNKTDIREVLYTTFTQALVKTKL